MIIRDVSEDFTLGLGKDLERSEGLHVSTVIRSIAVQMGYLKVDKAEVEEVNEEREFPYQAQLRMLAGLAWEQYLAKAHPWIDFHGGEVKRDGLAGTPDGTSIVGDYLIIHEFKFTWMSSNHLPDSKKLWIYRVQMLSYCAMMRCTRAYLHIYYVNGDYRGSGPQYKVFQFEFTRQQVENNWAMILKQASTVFGHRNPKKD